jgi:beta-N-acetylhexosaminidase
LVAAHGEQVIKAYVKYNMISTAKHFPGRGHGQTNAHHELECIDLSMDRLKAVELLPFVRAVKAGVDSVMMSHTLFPAIESKHLPASLSPAIVRYLRQELGFEGIIMTDSLCMFAIAKNFEIPRACAMSLEAGVDLIFMKVQGLYRPTRHP